MPRPCPLCGQKIVRPLGLDVVGQQRDMLAELLLAGEEGINQALLRERMFEGREDGGPLFAMQVVQQVKIKLNRALAPLRRRIEVVRRGVRARYYLRRTR